MWHSRSYHQYFEGYSERTVVDEKTGKTKRERYYTGNYYIPRLSREKWRLRKMEYLCMYLGAVLCFILTGILPAASNRHMLVIPLLLVTLVGMTWMILSLYSCLLAGEKLTEGEYRERQNMKALCTGLALAFAVTAVLRIGSMAWNRTVTDPAEWAAILGSLLDGAVFYGMCFLEKRLTFTRTLSDTKAPFDSYDIKYREQEFSDNYS